MALTQNLLGRWIKERENDDGHVFRGNGKLTPEQEELRRLREEGWLYLAVVIDLYSRKVVGWSMSSRIKALMVYDALKIAIWQRRPKAGLIHYSDRGSQYVSQEFRKLLKLLKLHSFNGSMSRKSDCWDTVAESFFANLKKERIKRKVFKTRDEARQVVFNYIEMFYNPIRRHTNNNRVSPKSYENEYFKQVESV